MNPQMTGLLIRRERVRRDWSQEGLCRGICAVSYLSKIEQGKAEASEEILSLLFQRLGLEYHACPDAGALIEPLYEALFSGELFWGPRRHALSAAFAGQKQALLGSGWAADAMLLDAFLSDESRPLPTELEPVLDPRQLALQRILQNRCDEAARLLPCALTNFHAGAEAYESGSNYTAAVEYLQTGYQQAAQLGAPCLMLHCQLFLGNCYCNLLDLPNMEQHYAIAARLARALNLPDELESIRYNTAATQLSVGRWDEAYAYFSQLAQPSRMSLHKLAICQEKRGEHAAALETIRRAETAPGDDAIDPALARLMCQVVRYRLEHPDYLHDPDYGATLLACFRRCRDELPSGYASFHLPWLLEWHTAARQYKQAYELLRSFPIKFDF